MIIGIGADVVAVRRFEQWLNRAGFLERFFHPDELAYARSCGKGFCESIAARFAAKEAFGKALGIGLVGICLKDIAVISRYGDRPALALFGSALRKAEQNNVRFIHLSLSHEKEYALAMVVLEG
ncbi:MAG: holo-ACP synthase [Spirochaetaceae bacterium]|nr:holo-ACP synthase [Spirochaetaceae bacterium]